MSLRGRKVVVVVGVVLVPALGCVVSVHRNSVGVVVAVGGFGWVDFVCRVVVVVCRLVLSLVVGFPPVLGLVVVVGVAGVVVAARLERYR